MLCDQETVVRTRRVCAGASNFGVDPNCYPAKHFCPRLNPVVRLKMVRREGIEPSSQAWEARILPMNYRRENGARQYGFSDAVNLRARLTDE